MKRRTKYIRRVVSSSDVRKYEQEFNKLADELSDKSPTIQDVFENGTFSTIFTYETEEQIPESAKDRAELEGIRLTCADCPYMEDDGDKRKRRFPCQFAEFGWTRSDTAACDKFYRDLMRGDIKPRG